MSQDIDAIYEDGVFRPLQPLAIPDGMRVQIHVDAADAELAGSAHENAETIQRQREALTQLRSKMAVLPCHAPQDGLGGADHDQILYGWKK